MGVLTPMAEQQAQEMDLAEDKGSLSTEQESPQLTVSELAPEQTPQETETEASEPVAAPLEEQQERNRTTNKGARPPKERLAEIFQSLPIPKGRVGWIIGKQGFSIQGLETKSGCAISVSDSPSREFGQEWSYIQLQGTTRAVDRAKKLIYLRLDSFPGQGHHTERRYHNGGRQTTNMHKKHHQHQHQHQHQPQQPFENHSNNPTAAMHVHHAQDPLA